MWNEKAFFLDGRLPTEMPPREVDSLLNSQVASLSLIVVCWREEATEPAGDLGMTGGTLEGWGYQG